MNTMLFFCSIIVCVNLYYGVKRGFVKMILPLLANIIALIFFSCTRGLWVRILFEWVFDEASLIVVRIIVLLLIYIVVMALVKLLIASLNLLTKLPVLHFFNKVLGVVTGAAQGVLLMWLFFAIVFLLKDTPFGIWALHEIEEQTYLSFLYQHNLVTYIIAEFV